MASHRQIHSNVFSNNLLNRPNTLRESVEKFRRQSSTGGLSFEDVKELAKRIMVVYDVPQPLATGPPPMLAQSVPANSTQSSANPGSGV